MTEYTDIEVIVFEDDAGNEMEMQIIDEYDVDGEHIIALSPPADADEDEDEVSFFVSTGEGDDFELELVEDEDKVNKLADILEDRLLNK